MSTVDVTCLSTTTLWLARSGGVNRVEDDGDSGPPVVRVAEALIDDAAACLPWRATGTKGRPESATPESQAPVDIDGQAVHWTQRRLMTEWNGTE